MGKIVKETIVETIDCIDNIYKKYKNITQLPVVSAYWDDETGTFIFITSQEAKSYLIER